MSKAFWSLSARRAWIEISPLLLPLLPRQVALRKESVDRNPMTLWKFAGLVASLSARRAWIEISPRLQKSSGVLVALRKESVDRNHMPHINVFRLDVALRKESVDRNVAKAGTTPTTCLSLSARRAWIEMLLAMLMRSPIGGRSPQGERG